VWWRRQVAKTERHLRTVIREFVEHYHSERNHQGLGNVIPFPSAGIPARGGICRRERLGGLLNSYERKAAESRGGSAVGQYGGRALAN
jgi:hypothetical protein